MVTLKSIASAAFLAGQAATTTEAFSLPPHHSHAQLFRQTRSALLRGTAHPDASEAITEALRLSKTFGPRSDQARAAWDIVEEMDDNNSDSIISAHYRLKSNPNLDYDDPRDYRDRIRSLSRLLEETNSKLSHMKILLDQIEELETKDPALARIPDDAADGTLKAALADAKAAVAMYVYDSSALEAHEARDELDSRSRFGDSSEDGVSELAEECDTEPSDHRYSAAALKDHHLHNAMRRRVSVF
eukprot:160760_1